jgi:outer membrane biogenesis lipoprotein LolB
MRKFFFFLLTACLVVLLGCGKQEEPTKAKKPVRAGQVKKETKEAAEAIKEYTLQRKEDLQKSYDQASSHFK